MTSLGNKEIMAKNIEYYLSLNNTTKKELAERLDIPFMPIPLFELNFCFSISILAPSYAYFLLALSE